MTFQNRKHFNMKLTRSDLPFVMPAIIMKNSPIQ